MTPIEKPEEESYGGSEQKSLLERTYHLVEENNRMLLSIRKTARLTLWFRVAYWGLIIALSFGAFYFIQPYITSLTSGLGLGNGSFSSEFQNVLKEYQGQGQNQNQSQNQ